MRRAQKHVKQLHTTEQTNKEAKDNYDELQVMKGQIGNSTPAKLELYDKKNEKIITAYHNIVKVKRDRGIIAEERFIKCMNELKEKGKLLAQQRRKDRAEAKIAKKQTREGEKKAKEEKEAVQKAEKKAIEEKKKEAEEDIKLQRQELRAAESLALRAKALESSAEKLAAADRAKVIDAKVIAVLDLSSRTWRRDGAKRGRVGRRQWSQTAIKRMWSLTMSNRQWDIYREWLASVADSCIAYSTRSIRMKLCTRHAALNILACLSTCLGNAVLSMHALCFNHPNTSSTIKRLAVNSLLYSIIPALRCSSVCLSMTGCTIGTNRCGPSIKPPSASMYSSSATYCV